MNKKKTYGNYFIKKYLLFTITAYFFLFPNIPAAQTIQQHKIEFKAHHLIKTITGTCPKVNHQNPDIIKKDSRYYLEKPFHLSIDVLSIKTGNKNRDSNLYELLGYPQYRSIDIVTESISYSDTKAILKGHIQIAGKTKPFVAGASVNEEGASLIIKGESQILLSQFDITPPSFLGMPVRDRVDIYFQYDITLNK